MLFTIKEVKWVSPLDSTTNRTLRQRLCRGPWRDDLNKSVVVWVPDVLSATVLNPTALLDYAGRYCWTAARRRTAARAARAARCGLAARTLSAGRRRAATGRSCSGCCVSTALGGHVHRREQ